MPIDGLGRQLKVKNSAGEIVASNVPISPAFCFYLDNSNR